MKALVLASACLLALGLQAQSISLDFSTETLGAEPKSMLPMVGSWTIAKEGQNLVLKVDGGKWQEGQCPVLGGSRAIPKLTH